MSIINNSSKNKLKFYQLSRDDGKGGVNIGAIISNSEIDKYINQYIEEHGFLPYKMVAELQKKKKEEEQKALEEKNEFEKIEDSDKAYVPPKGKEHMYTCCKIDPSIKKSSPFTSLDIKFKLQKTRPDDYLIKSLKDLGIPNPEALDHNDCDRFK